MKPNYRSSGVGTQFFAYLEANPENDSVAFMLETVMNNENAIRFYKKMGFVEEGLVKKYRKLDSQYYDCLFMAKDLLLPE